MSREEYHFTLGPVQGFIAQARKTRDLWAGSYLLSYLSGVAMHACGAGADETAKILYPPVERDPLMQAIRANEVPGSIQAQAARVGSLPNRFSAFPAPDATDAPEHAVADAWEKVCGAVWRWLHDRAGTRIQQPEVQAQWQRQVERFWEITWIIGGGQHLDQRKNLRAFRPLCEAGEKCTICGERSALCDGDGSNRRAVQGFWRDIARAVRTRLELQEDADEELRKSARGWTAFSTDGSERLCAICTVKRVFPFVAQDALGPGADRGWPVPVNYPSTATMSAVLWRKDVLKAAKDEKDNETVRKALREFCKVLSNCRAPPHDAGVGFRALEEALQQLDPAEQDDCRIFIEVDGDLLFPEALEAAEDLPERVEQARASIREKLADLRRAVDSEPKPFYALLVMDGDGFGKALSQGDPREISTAVSRFPPEVVRLVEQEHSGKVVYCGGDDVLALLPVDEALPCADRLRAAYEACFSDELRKRTGLSFTISAAVVFAHMNTALRSVIQDAHRLLDEVAKEELGRNAFAVRVWKRGGPILTWGKPWQAPSWVGELQWLKASIGERTDTDGSTDRAAEPDAAAVGVGESIGERTDADGSTGIFSNRFIYRLRDLFDLLQPRAEAGGRAGTELQEVQEQLLLAEHRSTRREGRGRGKEEDKRDIRRLLDLCLEGWNESGQPRSGTTLLVEAALLARFLSQKEV